MSPPQFSADDAAQVAHFHSPSALAIASLLLGLASPLCALGPLLLVVPLVGAAIGLLALRRIAGSDGALIGARAARLGVALSIACGAAVATHAAYTRHLQVGQAADFGRQWLALVTAGDVRQAFEFASFGPRFVTISPDEPPPPGGDPFQRLVSLPIVQELSAAGSSADVRLGRTVRYAAMGKGEFMVRQQYVVSRQAAGAGDAGLALQPLIVELTLHRTRPAAAAHTAWFVASVESGEDANTDQAF
jgi:hypothetical protein